MLLVASILLAQTYFTNTLSRIVAVMSSSASRQRPLIIGPDEGPAAPFPIKLSGPVIAGFGRGSKQVRAPDAPIMHRLSFALLSPQARSR